MPRSQIDMESMNPADIESEIGHETRRLTSFTVNGDVKNIEKSKARLEAYQRALPIATERYARIYADMERLRNEREQQKREEVARVAQYQAARARLISAYHPPTGDISEYKWIIVNAHCNGCGYNSDGSYFSRQRKKPICMNRLVWVK